MSHQKYVYIALNRKNGKWKSIALQNETEDMSKRECIETLEYLHPILLKRQQERIDHLKKLKAPNIIIEPELKALNTVKNKKGPNLSPLNRKLK